MTVTMRDRPINPPWRPLALLASWRSAFPSPHDRPSHRDNSREFPILRKCTITPAPPSPDARPMSRSRMWPGLFAALVVVINGIALAILSGDTTMRRDGILSAEMVRDAFITMTQLNILLGAFGLASIVLTGRVKN